MIYFVSEGAPQSLFGGRRLTALIGLSRALDLLMTGRPISGAEANVIGLACKLTTTGTGKHKLTFVLILIFYIIKYNVNLYIVSY